jgi:hypothetical protein
LTDIGVSSLVGQAYRFPLATRPDTRVTHSDVQIDANSGEVADVAPYDGMSITYYAVAEVRSIGGVSRSFGIIIDGNGGTAEEIYEFVQWSLRRDVDIDAGAGSVIGQTADALLQFVGDTLYTLNATNALGGGAGVFIDNFDASDTNRLVFLDNSAVERTFPFLATLRLNFGANLVADPAAKYWVYFATLPGGGNDYGEAGAQLVDDADGIDMTGNVSGNTSITHTFAYESNVQGGRTANTDADVVVVVIGQDVAQYARAEVTIERATTNSVTVASALERTY